MESPTSRGRGDLGVEPPAKTCNCELWSNRQSFAATWRIQTTFFAKLRWSLLLLSRSWQDNVSQLIKQRNRICAVVMLIAPLPSSETMLCPWPSSETMLCPGSSSQMMLCPACRVLSGSCRSGRPTCLQFALQLVSCWTSLPRRHHRRRSRSCRVGWST